MNRESATRQVRAARRADLAAMLALERESASAAHWPENDYARLLGGGDELRRHSLVAEENGRLRGFLVARALGDEWEIENIVVSQSFRQQGLGSALLQSLLETARQSAARRIFLEVRESNTAARKLYEKWNFEEKGTRAGYYRDPDENAVLYRLEVSGGNSGQDSPRPGAGPHQTELEND